MVTGNEWPFLLKTLDSYYNKERSKRKAPWKVPFYRYRSHQLGRPPEREMKEEESASRTKIRKKQKRGIRKNRLIIKKPVLIGSGLMCSKSLSLLT